MPHHSSSRANLAPSTSSGRQQPPQAIQIQIGNWIQPNASDDASSLRTTPSLIEKSKSTSFESPNDVAAASLLLHAKAKHQLEESRPSPSTKMPLKKRIKATEDAFQLSPISYVTKVSLHSDESSRETHAPLTTKIGDFPAILHQVLSESEFSGKVLQWLPHGKSFRIVRFDALKKQVIPQFFPELNQDNHDSVDAFLAQLQSWGFREITQGTDTGAHFHKLFRQSLPQLAANIRFHVPLLQVPSLLSNASKDTESVVVRTPAGWPTWTVPMQVPPYSPIQQVRSTRGRHGMTISNRGKKSPGPRRISLPTSRTNAS